MNVRKQCASLFAHQKNVRFGRWAIVDTSAAKLTLALGSSARQQVALTALLILQFPSARNTETLLEASIGFILGCHNALPRGSPRTGKRGLAKITGRIGENSNGTLQ